MRQRQLPGTGFEDSRVASTEADVVVSGPKSPSRRGPHPLAVAAAALGALAAVLLLVQQQEEPEGTPDRLEFGAALNVSTGGLASLGTMEVDNPGRAAMQVEEVRLLHTEGVRLVDATVITPNDRAAYGFYDAGPLFPPSEWPYPSVRPLDATVPAEEFSRAPGEAPLSLKVMVGVEATRPGMVGFNGVEVIYKVGGRPHTERFAHGLVLCAPPSRCDSVDPAGAMVELGLLQD